MEVKPASVNLSENTGADGTMIYYVDAKKLFHVENSKQVSYRDGKEERIGMLNENDFTIGNCTYADYRESESTEEIDYHSLFLDADQ